MVFVNLGLKECDLRENSVNKINSYTHKNTTENRNSQVIYLRNHFSCACSRGHRSIDSNLTSGTIKGGRSTALRKFFYVTIPLLSPTLLFTLIMGLIWSFQVFTQAYVMTDGGPNNAILTYILYLYIYRSAFLQFKMGYASSLAWVFFLILVILVYLVFKSSSKWVYYYSK